MDQQSESIMAGISPIRKTTSLGQLILNCGFSCCVFYMNSVVPVIEVELKISEDLCDYCPVLWWHVHPHQDHHGHKVHAHDLRKEQHQNI